MVDSPPLLGRRRASLYLLLLIGAAILGWFEGVIWPVERLVGGWVQSGTCEWGMEDWSFDRRDGTVSGVVVHQDADGIASVDDARLSLFLMDEVTYDLERVGVESGTAIVEGGRRAEWHVRGYRVPPGKRFRGVALDGSLRDAQGREVRLGGEMAYGGPSWQESARLSDRSDRLASRGEEGVADAIEHLQDDDPIERGAAASALGRIAKRPDLAVAAILARLRVERYTLVQDDIVYALGHFGVAAGPAVPAVLDLARSDSTREQIRRAALVSLGRMGPSAAEAVPDLIRIVEGDRPLHRLLAVHALGQMGPSARAARPALEAVLGRTTDGNTTSAVREALTLIGE